MTPQQAAIKRATINAQRQMDRLDAEVLAELQRIYEEAAADLRIRIQGFGQPGGNLALVQLQELQQQVARRLQELSAARDALMDRGMSSAVHLGVHPLTIGGTGSVLSPALTDTAAMRVADEAVMFVRTFVAEDGLQLSDRIWRLDRHAKDVVTSAIELAVVEGHGAAQAARELLLRGRPLPTDIAAKVDAAQAAKVAQEAADSLMTGYGSPMDNAMRLMRTELNRAHGEAYIKGALEHPDAVGVRFKLSPAHPKHDICDLHAAANLYGLGRGVYPTRAQCPWPAHPNTLSYVEVVFKDEITDEDKEGKETPMEALERMSPMVRRGVLGKHKHEAFREGLLTQGMIKAPWSKVRQRLGKTLVRAPRPVPQVRKGNLPLDDMIGAGHAIADDLIKASRNSAGEVRSTVLLEKLHSALKEARPVMMQARVETHGKGADLVKAASMMFPDDWTRAADRYGPLYVRLSSARGGQVSLPKASAGRSYRNLLGFSGVARGGDGFIRTDSFSTALHEYAHRLQHVLPDLDDYFQLLHGRRTKGDALRRLRDLYPRNGYGKDEVTREDEYRHAYQGREYSGFSYLGRHGALEVLTMAFEDVLGGQPWRLQELVEKDREMLDLVIGLLFNYVP